MGYTKKEYAIYNKGYNAGARRVTIEHLGRKCEVCGYLEITQLEIHHKTIPKSRSTNQWYDLGNLRLLCKKCHSETPAWCNKNPRGGSEE